MGSPLGDDIGVTKSELFIHIAKDCLRLVYRILMTESQ